MTSITTSAIWIGAFGQLLKNLGQRTSIKTRSQELTSIAMSCELKNTGQSPPCPAADLDCSRELAAGITGEACANRATDLVGPCQAFVCPVSAEVQRKRFLEAGGGYLMDPGNDDIHPGAAGATMGIKDIALTAAACIFILLSVGGILGMAYTKGWFATTGHILLAPIRLMHGVMGRMLVAKENTGKNHGYACRQQKKRANKAKKAKKVKIDADSDKPESGKTESGKPESGKHESGKPESCKPESDSDTCCETESVAPINEEAKRSNLDDPKLAEIIKTEPLLNEKLGNNGPAADPTLV